LSDWPFFGRVGDEGCDQGSELEFLGHALFIPMSFQDETNSLVFWTSGVVARSLQIAADMRLARASPEVQNPARLSLILKAHWN
jgi:hypothetical protein